MDKSVPRRVKVDEISAAPAGSGGLYVGMSLQSGEARVSAISWNFRWCRHQTLICLKEIAKHPRKEFDGWLVGGNRKAPCCINEMIQVLNAELSARTENPYVVAFAGSKHMEERHGILIR